MIIDLKLASQFFFNFLWCTMAVSRCFSGWQFMFLNLCWMIFGVKCLKFCLKTSESKLCWWMLCLKLCWIFIVRGRDYRKFGWT